jgi:hypothetical protein
LPSLLGKAKSDRLFSRNEKSAIALTSVKPTPEGRLMPNEETPKKQTVKETAKK